MLISLECWFSSSWKLQGTQENRHRTWWETHGKSLADPPNTRDLLGPEGPCLNLGQTCFSSLQESDFAENIISIRKRNNSAKYIPSHMLVSSVGNWKYLWGYLHTGGDEEPLSDWEPLDKLCPGLFCIEQLISKCCHIVFHSLGLHPTPVQSSLPISGQHNEFKTQIRKILHWKLTHSSTARISLENITCRTELSILNTQWPPHLCRLVPSNDNSLRVYITF